MNTWEAKVAKTLDKLLKIAQFIAVGLIIELLVIMFFLLA